MIYLYSSNRLELLAEKLAGGLSKSKRKDDPGDVDGKSRHRNDKGFCLTAFTPDLVVVQSQGMERWVKLRIAEHNGVCANLHCPFPKAFLMECLEKSIGVPDQNLFSRQALIWRIYGLLGDNATLTQPEFEPLHRYIGDGQRDLKRYQLAEKLGTLFDQYLTFRPATIMAWSGYDVEQIPFSDPVLFRSAVPDGEMGGDGQTLKVSVGHPDRFTPMETHATWQHLLWQKLYTDAPGGTLLNRVAEFLFSDITQWQHVLPGEVHLFGMSSIPLQFMLFFEKLSQIADVHLYYLSPCREFWEDCVKEKTKLILDIKSGDADMARMEDLYWEVGNPLLSSMGISARDFSRAVTGIEGAVMATDQSEMFTPSLTDDEAKRLTSEFIEKAKENVGLFDAFDVEHRLKTYSAANLLHRIQNDILFLRDTSSNVRDSRESASTEHSKVHFDDESIAVHVCHSRMREVEVLFDQLLNMMAKDSTLHAGDILVMTPDIAQCAPYIKAVFDTPETPEMKIPYSIADRMPGQENPVASAFLKLVKLHQSRFTAVDVLDILRVEAVHTRFGLDDAGLELIYRWIDESGIRWGIDKAFKEEVGLPGHHQNSWRFGFDRMLMGYAVPQNQGVVHSVLPLDIEGNDAEITGRFMGFFDQLSRCAEEIRGLARKSEMATADRRVKKNVNICEPGKEAEGEEKRTAAVSGMEMSGMEDIEMGSKMDIEMDAWESLFTRVLSGFFEETPDTEGDIHDVRTAVNQLFDTIRESGYSGTVGLDALLCDLEARLQDDSGARGFLHGGVTFCRFRPMRSIPARVICLIGMDEGAYPRQQRKAGFDLMAAAPLPGDNSGRTEERYLFLEALLSAKDTLYISYVGRSIKDNASMPPSILVSELLSYIGDAGRTLIVEHPLQPFSHRYFDGSDPRLFSFSTAYRKGAEAILPGAKRDIDGNEKKMGDVARQPSAELETKTDVNGKTDANADPGSDEKADAKADSNSDIDVDAAPKLSAPSSSETLHLHLESLMGFINNPARFYLRDMLNIRLQQEEPTQPEIDEPFEWQNRAFFRDSAAVDQMIMETAFPDFDRHYQDNLAAGTMPMGFMEKRRFEAYFNELTQFSESVKSQKEEKVNAPCSFSTALKINILDGLGLGGKNGGNAVDVLLDGTIAGYYPGFGVINYRYSGTKERIYLQSWIEGLVLTCSDIPCENLIIIHRGAKKGDPPVVAQLEIPSKRTCESILAGLIQLYLKGRSGLVPFFPRASFVCAEKLHKGVKKGDPFEVGIAAAKHTWNPTFGDGRECGDAYFNIAFGDGWFDSASNLQLQRFFDLALDIYVPMLERLTS